MLDNNDIEIMQTRETTERVSQSLITTSGDDAMTYKDHTDYSCAL